MGVPEFVVGFSREEPSLTGVARFPEADCHPGFSPRAIKSRPVGAPQTENNRTAPGLSFRLGAGEPQRGGT